MNCVEGPGSVHEGGVVVSLLMYGAVVMIRAKERLPGCIWANAGGDGFLRAEKKAVNFLYTCPCRIANLRSELYIKDTVVW